MENVNLWMSPVMMRFLLKFHKFFMTISENTLNWDSVDFLLNFWNLSNWYGCLSTSKILYWISLTFNYFIQNCELVLNCTQFINFSTNINSTMTQKSSNNFVDEKFTWKILCHEKVYILINVHVNNTKTDCCFRHNKNKQRKKKLVKWIFSLFMTYNKLLENTFLIIANGIFTSHIFHYQSSKTKQFSSFKQKYFFSFSFIFTRGTLRITTKIDHFVFKAAYCSVSGNGKWAKNIFVLPSKQEASSSSIDQT